MSTTPNIIETINNRFYNLLIGLSNAQEVAGVDVEGKVKAEHSEQFDSRRALLRVEKLAKRDMELNKRSEQNFIDGISAQLNDVVTERLLNKLEDLDDVHYKVLGLNDNLPEILDALSVRAVSIAKLEPLIAETGWLATDLLKLVNTPKFRKTDRLGKVVVVENLKMALSFIGIENLKMLIPAKIFKRAIPQITDPFPAFKNRIWEHALASAISCQHMAKLNKAESSHAFTLGMFHELGKLAIAKLYFRTFDETHREALIEAHDNLKREEHTALQKIAPSSDYLLALIWEHSQPLSAKIIEKMSMKRVFIANAMQEFANKVPYKTMTPLAQVLLQGNGYSKFNALKSVKLITTDEAKLFLKSLHITPTKLQAMKSIDTSRLNISTEDEE
ncbi:HDOD domain-containing protein [Alteromonas sp. a30]|uniref:HDOD domain-containing protein n=1 Tax=Alteromonas sp. a30 TaxID=2730917 RepID=UPI0022810849|nr:HDOD domain-containing protein [Alteromonas sp. a30]MCY7295313.1 HDOD domain-containing protein [Alteromonas sp. a30]